VLRAAGRHVDVLSVNYYHAWTPAAEKLELWTRESGRPVLVSEFYAKGADTGMENKNGAGWLVRTQQDRGRFYENSIHQIDHYGVFDQLQTFIPGLRPIELLVGLAAMQNDEDRQDPHLLARHLYRDRLPIAGIPPTAPPTSLLWIEGIGDGIVSNNATRSAARELGIPQVERVKRASPGLDVAPAPLSANVGPPTTAGHFQSVPSATPSCVGVVFSNPGHHCPQRATEGRNQILHFFSTALGGGAPEIIDPLP